MALCSHSIGTGWPWGERVVPTITSFPRRPRMRFGLPVIVRIFLCARWTRWSRATIVEGIVVTTAVVSRLRDLRNRWSLPGVHCRGAALRERPS